MRIWEGRREQIILKHKIFKNYWQLWTRRKLPQTVAQYFYYLFTDFLKEVLYLGTYWLH